MKAVILAGGLGTRLSEETSVKPKPMVEIGGKPILWHIMKIYSSHGINDFIICCGYKGYIIKEYFANYYLHTSDITFDMVRNNFEVHQTASEPWRVTLIDTGNDAATGGRLKRVRDYLDDDDFCFTYGDGVSDVDIKELITFHKDKGKLATVTAIQPPSRFGVISFRDSHEIQSFDEKPHGEGGWINGGYFILSPKVIDYIEDDQTAWEYEPMHNLIRDKQFSAFLHKGFWQSMDTLRDRNRLEDMWAAGNAPWKNW